MLDLLLESTVKILDTLMAQYKNGILCYNDFISHTHVKATFLKEHIAQFKDPKGRKHAEDILKEMDKVIIKSSQ